MNLNVIVVSGNLTKDIELRYSASGKPVCTMTIANNSFYKKDSENVQEASFFDVDVWGVIAENCNKYLNKGSGVIVEGRLKQERWEQEGNKRSRIKIIASKVNFIPRRNDNGDQQINITNPVSETKPRAIVEDF